MKEYATYVEITGHTNKQSAMDYLRPFGDFNNSVAQYVADTFSAISKKQLNVTTYVIASGYGTDYIAIGIQTANNSTFDYYISNPKCKLVHLAECSQTEFLDILYKQVTETY